MIWGLLRWSCLHVLVLNWVYGHTYSCPNQNEHCTWFLSSIWKSRGLWKVIWKNQWPAGLRRLKYQPHVPSWQVLASACSGLKPTTSSERSTFTRELKAAAHVLLLCTSTQRFTCSPGWCISEQRVLHSPWPQTHPQSVTVVPEEGREKSACLAWGWDRPLFPLSEVQL